MFAKRSGTTVSGKGLLKACIFTMTIAAVSLLAGCGGGGGSQSSTNNAPLDTTSTVAPNVKVRTATLLNTITSEAPGQIVVHGVPTEKIGDVIITSKTALKISEISDVDSNGNTTISGTVPDLGDVFKNLDINIQHTLSPDQFVPADSSVTVAAVTPTSEAAANNPSNKTAQSVKTTTATVSTQLKVSLTKKINSAVSGSLDVTLSPTLDYKVANAKVT